MFASALLPIGLAGLASAGQLFNRQTQACSSGLHVIATAGANSTDPYSYGLLGSLASSIVAAVPGSDMVSMPYNKTLVNAATTTAGEVTFVQYINEYHAACPQGKIALIGYSSGAIITMSGICQATSPLLSQDLADSTIVATVVYGDPTRVAGQPYDLGTCTGVGNLTRLRNPALCGTYIPGLQSYCDTNDPQCCDGPPADFQIHFVYPSKYDQAATQWVVQRYNAAVGGTLGSTNSSSSSSASSTSTSSSTSSSSSTSTTSSTSSTSTSSSTSAAASTSSSVAPLTSSSSSSSAAGTTSSRSSSATPSASASLAPGSNGASLVAPASFSVGALLFGAVAAFF